MRATLLRCCLRGCMHADNLTYNALGLVKTVQNAFFDVRTPLSLLKRAQEGKTEDLGTVLSDWVPW